MAMRTVISSVEVDPLTGAGIPRTGGTVMIETVPCPNTCRGWITRVIDLTMRPKIIGCPYCW